MTPGWWWLAWLIVVACWVLIAMWCAERAAERRDREPWLPDDDDRRRWRP